MKNSSKSVIQTFIALILAIGLIIPAVNPAPVGEARLDPLLAQAIAEDPGSMVRVIVGKSNNSDSAERSVESLGGEVIKDLGLIHAFAALLPAKAVPRLAQLDSVSRISIDPPVRSTALVTQFVLDEFNTVSYSNNDGSANWADDWVEINESNGPSTGDERIVSDSGDKRLRIRDNDGGGEGVQRQVDLSEATSAMLSLDYRRKNLDDTNDYVALEISADGGLTWTELDRIAGPDNDSVYQAWSADISEYLSANTTIRLLSSSSMGYRDLVYFDNVTIEFIVGDPIVPVPIEPGEYDPIETKTVADDFEAIPFTFRNQSGTLNWTSDWIEGGENDGPGAGSIQIIPFGDGHGLQLHGNQLSIERSLDLTGATFAKFRFEYQRKGFEDDDYFYVERSSDGGFTWTELGRVNGTNPGTSPVEVGGFELMENITSDTVIRFKIVLDQVSPKKSLTLDNVTILFDKYTGPTPENFYLGTLHVYDAWSLGLSGNGVTVAVVDSGITHDLDFGFDTAPAPTDSDRLLAQVAFTNLTTTLNDMYGHGTHVAGIIGGVGFKSGGTYIGVAPQVNLIGLKVSDDHGMAYESDTVAALQWVFDNKDAYNIRVVNLSIQSTVEQSYHESALDAAAEILWFNGVVVVAAAGNKSEDLGYDPIMAAPANDPFLITVGATDEKGDSNRINDKIAPFSSYMETEDFFIKPEIHAPGKDIVSVLATSSWWRNDHPERFVEGGYFRISGTSMSTPMVAGTIAMLLESEPNLTPDQVKYRLMDTAGKVGKGNYLDAYAAVTTPTIEVANQGVTPHMLLAKMALVAYWASENGEGNIDWENVDWDAVNWDAVNWNVVNWDAVNWNAVNWNAVNWNAVNWNAVNWNAVNWNAVNWNAVNWNAVNWNAVNWNAVNWNAVNWND